MNEEKLNKLLDVLSSIDSSLSSIAKSLDGLNENFGSCISANQNSRASQAMSRHSMPRNIKTPYQCQQHQ